MPKQPLDTKVDDAEKTKARQQKYEDMVKEFQDFSLRHGKGHAEMGLENSSFFPNDPMELAKHRDKFAQEHGMKWDDATKSLKAVRVEKKELDEGKEKVGELFGGRQMQNAGAAVHGGNQTTWSPTTWGGDGKKSESDWPSKLELYNAGNGHRAPGGGSILPAPRTGEINPAEGKFWKAFSEIPELDRVKPVVAELKGGPRVAQGAKKLRGRWRKLRNRGRGRAAKGIRGGGQGRGGGGEEDQPKTGGIGGGVEDEMEEEESIEDLINLGLVEASTLEAIYLA